MMAERIIDFVRRFSVCLLTGAALLYLRVDKAVENVCRHVAAEDKQRRKQRNAEKKDWLKGHTYYKHIGLYAYRTEVLREITALPQSSLEIAESLEQLRWLENGYKIKVGISEVETIGIDTPQDLARAEEFLKNRL